MAEQVAMHLRKAGYMIAEPEALNEMLKIAKEYNISAATVVEDFDIMNDLKENKSIDVCLSHVNTKQFRDFVAKQHGNGKPGGHHPAVKLPFGSSWENMSDRDIPQYQPTPKRQAIGATPTHQKMLASNLAMRTPTATRTPIDADRVNSQQTASASASKFSSRTNKGEVVCVLNDHLPEWQAPSSSVTTAGGSALQLLTEALPPVGQHLFMQESLTDKVFAVDERLQDWAQHLSADIPEASEAETTSVTQITQEPAWCVGRIVLEYNGEEGPATKLSASSLYIEGLRSASDGARVRLDVSSLMKPEETGQRFFPGQMVAVHGLNPTGQTLVAKRVITALPAPQAPQAAGPCCIMAAAGPYTTSDCLTYCALEQLLQHAEACKPDVLMLMGPYVDSNHPTISSGNLNQSYDQLFQDEVVHRVSIWQAKNPRTTVSLIPSVQDAHHANVLPTPPFALQQSVPGNRPDGLQSLQNPCLASMPGGLAVGASSSDVLKALSGNELAVGAPGSDRLGSLAAQVLGQRHFFPVMPAPIGTCLDLSHDSAMQLTVTPHLLLLPSDLMPFAKLLQLPAASSDQTTGDQVVCVNPGRVMRGTIGGTFAIVCIHAGEGNAASRCRVEVRKV